MKKSARILSVMTALILMFCLTGCNGLMDSLESQISELGESVLSQANSEDPESPSEDAETEETVVTVEELAEPVQRLVEQSDEVYDIFYNGLEYTDEPVADSDGNPTSWYPVNDDRFHSLDDLRAFAEQTFTQAYANAALYSTAFEGDYPKYSVMNNALCVNMDSGGLGWGLAWKYDTMEIVSQTENSVVVEMETTLFDEEEGTAQLVLARVNGEWRLDSSTIG